MGAHHLCFIHKSCLFGNKRSITGDKKFYKNLKCQGPLKIAFKTYGSFIIHAYTSISPSNELDSPFTRPFRIHLPSSEKHISFRLSKSSSKISWTKITSLWCHFSFCIVLRTVEWSMFLSNGADRELVYGRTMTFLLSVIYFLPPFWSVARSVSPNFFPILQTKECKISFQSEYLLLNKVQTALYVLVSLSQPIIIRISIRCVSVRLILVKVTECTFETKNW